MTVKDRKRLLIGVCIIACFVFAGWFVVRERQTPKSLLVISFSHFETHGNTDYAVILVTNVGNRTASFRGYGQEWPFYYIATASGTNWSWDYTPGFDRDQARPVRLPQGASMPVRTDVPIPDKWIVGIPYCDATGDELLPRRVWLLLQRFNPVKKRESIAWSELLTRKTKPTDVVPRLIEQTREQGGASQK